MPCASVWLLVRSLRRRMPAIALAGAVAAGLAAGPAGADGSGSVHATLAVIPMLVRSVTVSPSSLSMLRCTEPTGGDIVSFLSGLDNGVSTGDQMVLPYGRCGAQNDTINEIFNDPHPPNYVTVTNSGNLPDLVSVQGTDAMPSDGGTPWALTTQKPGTDQFAMWNGYREVFLGLQPTYISTSPTPDAQVEPGVGNRGVLAAGASAGEGLNVEGPSASSDPSTQFSTTVTWIATAP